MSELRTSKIIKRLRPRGASGSPINSGEHNQDDLVRLFRNGQDMAQKFNEMWRSEPQIRKVIGAVVNPIRSAKYDIEPPTITDPKDLEVAALIKQILFKDIRFSKFLNEALTCFRHGYSIFEIVHKNRENAEFGQYTGLGCLGFRDQTTIEEWDHDEDTGELRWVRQNITGDIHKDVMLPVETLLIFYNEQEGDSNGFPILRPLFGPWKRKKLELELMMIGIEKYAIPTPLLTTPGKVDIKDPEYLAAVASLESFTIDEQSFIIVPQGWELEMFGNDFDPTKVQAVIKMEDEMMMGSILASFLELGTGGNSGAFALSNDQSDFFFATIEYTIIQILEVINQELIPSLVRMNFGDSVEQMPQLTVSGISDKAGIELMKIITGYQTAGLLTPDPQLEDNIRKQHNLPKRPEGEVVEQADAGGDNDDGGNDDQDPTPTGGNSNDSSTDEGESITLADITGHHHRMSNGRKTGPARIRGQGHFHEVRDSQGELVGRTSVDPFGAGHTHIDHLDKETVELIVVLLGEESEPKNNPKTLIESGTSKLSTVMVTNLTKIGDKFIADVMRKFRQLPENSKGAATRKQKVGGKAQFRKEMSGVMASLANDSLKMAKREVPGNDNVKLSDKYDHLPNAETFKFNDFSNQSRRTQLLLGNQANQLSEKEANDLAAIIALQFNNSMSNGQDEDKIKQELEVAADGFINSNRVVIGAGISAALAVNEVRNSFFFDEEILTQIQSFTFVNFDPKSDICRRLAGTTFATNDKSMIEFQPPLHQNCKSYLRPNLVDIVNAPDITGVPTITDNDRKSITLGDCCHGHD